MRRLAIYAALFATTSLFAQTEPPRNVVLSAIVTDARGNRINSLGKDDFVLTEHGKSTMLGEVVEMRAVPEAGAHVRLAEPRRIAIVFDVSTLSLAARRTAVDALRPFLKTALRPSDRVLILTASQALRPMMPTWTADPALIDKAIDGVEMESSDSLAGDREAAQKRIETMITEIRQSVNSGMFSSFDTLLQAGRDYAATARRDVLQSIALYSTTLELFPRRGTKNVMLIIGAGLPRQPGGDVFLYLDSLKAQAERGEMGATLRRGSAVASPLAEVGSYEVTQPLSDLADDAFRRGVAIYALDSQMGSGRTTTTEQGTRRDTTAEFAGKANQMEGYRLLADATGGVPLFGRQPGDALSDMRADLDAYYTLAFTPASPVRSRREVDVRAKHGYRVRLALGGGPTTPQEEVQAQVIAHHLMPPDSNDLGISVDSAMPVAEGTKRRIALRVKIPIRNLRLIEEQGAITGAFDVYVTTGDRGGRSSRVTRQTHTIRWPSDALQRIGDKEIIYNLDVVLEPGRTQVSVGVLDQKSGKTGYGMVSAL